jgi:hypothetical protein
MFDGEQKLKGGSAVWQRRLATPFGSAVWQRHLAAPFGSAVQQCRRSSAVCSGAVQQCRRSRAISDFFEILKPPPFSIRLLFFISKDLSLCVCVC